MRSSARTAQSARSSSIARASTRSSERERRAAARRRRTVSLDGGCAGLLGGGRTARAVLGCCCAVLRRCVVSWMLLPDAVRSPAPSCELRRVSGRLRAGKRSQRRTAARSESTLLRVERVVLRSALATRRRAARVHDPTHVYSAATIDRQRRARRIDGDRDRQRAPDARSPPPPRCFPPPRGGVMGRPRARFPDSASGSAQRVRFSGASRRRRAQQRVERRSSRRAPSRVHATRQGLVDLVVSCVVAVRSSSASATIRASTRSERSTRTTVARRVATRAPFASRSSLPLFAASLRVLTSTRVRAMRDERSERRARELVPHGEASPRVLAAVCVAVCASLPLFAVLLVARLLS